MKIRELKVLSAEELKEKLETLTKQLMELEFKRKTGAEKPHMFKQTRRDCARIRTILRERELNRPERKQVSGNIR